MLNGYMFCIYGKMLFICAYCVIFCHLFLFHASFSQYIFFFPFFNNHFSLSPSSFSPILLYSLQLFFHFSINTFSFFHIFLSARSSFYFYRRFSLHFPRINARIPHRIYGFCRKGPLMNLLNEENPVHIFLNKIGDIIIANLLFILCCIPVITIGPALTALYHCMLRTVKGNNNGTVKTFFRAFKENFIQSLVVWLCLLAGALILVLNINFLQSSASPAANVLFYVSLGIAGLLVPVHFSGHRRLCQHNSESGEKCFRLCLYAFSLHSGHCGAFHFAYVYDLSGFETNAPVCLLLVFLRIWADCLHQFPFVLPNV